MPVGHKRFLHNLTEGFFRRTVGGAVVIGKVEVRDAFVEGIVRHRLRIGKRIHIAEVVPQTKGDFGEQNAALTATAELHAVVIPVGCRGVNGINHRTIVLKVKNHRNALCFLHQRASIQKYANSRE